MKFINASNLTVLNDNNILIGYIQLNENLNEHTFTVEPELVINRTLGMTSKELDVISNTLKALNER